MPFVLAVDVATILRGVRADSGEVEDAHMLGTAAAPGEVTPDIRIMDTPAIVSGITAWVMAIRTMGPVITVTARAGTMIRITDIIPTDTIPTDTDTGRP